MPSEQNGLAKLDEEIRVLVASPSTSHWLRAALQTALVRDPVDVANDAEFLSDLLGRRCDALLKFP
ncbi:hypothetical protein [Pseudomonas frederiksbergensis]|uniref:hypothetical protein n=1 Tax=Pseudomonas frederiksbergensis TaxID=104087 RepID=UPI0008FB453F|nr:hypothetical protein [Pseudomonas frederiksbergensis]